MFSGAKRGGFEGKERELGLQARKRVAKEETTGRKQACGKKDDLQQPCPLLFFKLNSFILYLNLTHPTRKTTTHATPENNKGKRRPQITSNC